MRVHDTSPALPHGAPDLVGVEPATQQAERGTSAAELLGGACEQLDRFAEALAHEPQQVLDDALLAAGRAVAVVQEENHRIGA